MAASCPICFEEPADGESRFLIRGRYCKHGFCKACLEAILLVSPGSDKSPPPPPPLLPPPAIDSDASPRHPSDVAIVGVPTQGACPICRSRLSLFDLRWINDAEEIDDEGDDDASDSEGSHNDKGPAYVYHDEIAADWRKTPLVGRVYAARPGPGYASYHFDPNDPQFSDPHMDCTGTRGRVELRPGLHFDWRFAIRHSRWHGPSRTLRAVLDTAAGPPGNEIIVSFSPNLHHIRAAAMVIRPAEISCLDEMYDRHPFDGTYRVVRLDLDAANETAPATHVITGDRVTTLDSTPDHKHLVTFDKDTSSVRIGCYGHPDTHRETSFCFMRRPLGPREGDTVRFHVAGIVGRPNLFEEWTMTRKSTTSPPSEVTYLGPTGASSSYCRQWTAAEQLPPIVRKYQGSSLWGNSFCQYGSHVGQESYNFVLPSSKGSGESGGRGGTGKIVAYISYANPGNQPLVPLDDGSDLPERVYFRNATYDASTRTFVGSLKWLDDWGVTFQRMKRWDVKLRFDTEFTCILAGIVKA
jgi:Zinc finger, C3HC4 type (RING finger)